MSIFSSNLGFGTFAPIIRNVIRYSAGVIGGLTPAISDSNAETAITLIVLAGLALFNESWYKAAKANGFNT